MGEVVHTGELTPESIRKYAGATLDQVYNGLDCCVTLEVLDELKRMSNQIPLVYDFERALQAPALEMMLRGFKVDKYECGLAQEDLRKQIKFLSDRLQRMCAVFVSFPLGKNDPGILVNPNSPKQLQEFFYKHLHLPEVWTYKAGKKSLSMDREALEKHSQHYYAMPICTAILGIREHSKSLKVLESEVDPDGRMRTSYNIAATETGRWSSSKSAEGTGGNLQNWKERLRRVLVADYGWKLGAIDLEQADSREIGFTMGVLFDDWTYLDACEGGDLHTATAKLVWPELRWTGDRKLDRAIADEIFYRDFSYRDMSKRGGHGCLTADHEVLTRYGWVSIASKPFEVLTWSEHSSCFAQVSHWADHLYTGELHSFEGNSISACMTHDHRVPYKADINLKERLAKDGPHGRMPLGDNYVGGNKEVPARLIAAFISDGHQKSVNRMQFHFHKDRKKIRLKQLCKLYGFTWDETGDYIHVDGALPKTLDGSSLEWTVQCIKDFIDEYHYWDGTTDGTRRTLYSKDRDTLEWLQTLGRITGIGGQIQKPYKSGFGTTMYRLQQNNRKWATGNSVVWTKQSCENVKVYCPTVPSSWIYVRRHGKIFVTGNTTYVGTPFTMARHLKVPTKVMELFQDRFFSAYPGIPKLHLWTAKELQTSFHIRTYFGRDRHFFGRPNDDATLREAVAFLGQSPTADRMSRGVYNMWSTLRHRIRLIGQLHDAVYYLYRPEEEAEIVPLAVKCCEIPVFAPNGRRFVVPGEAKIGWNWSRRHDDSKPIHPTKNQFNPNGLIKFNPAKPDLRKREDGELISVVSSCK